MPLVTGGGSSEDAVEGGESGGGVNPTIDVDRGFPLVFTPFNDVSFGDVVGGENVFPLEPRLPTLDGRDGGLTIGAGVADKFLECRFDFSQSVRRRLWPTLSDRPCTPDMAPAVVGSGSSPPSLFRESGRRRRCLTKFGLQDPRPHRHHLNPKNVDVWHRSVC
jgi:hypothetical protein